MSVYLYARVSTDKQENLFPMCEGVDRHAATGSRPGLTLPRVRGGGPGSSSGCCPQRVDGSLAARGGSRAT